MVQATLTPPKTQIFRPAANVFGLTLDQVRAAAPSALATTAHSSRSAKYTHITSPITALATAGFECVYAQQSGTRKVGYEEFTKHLLRFRHRDALGKATPETIEIGISNSHAGESAYDLYIFIYVLVCTNGLVRSEKQHRLKVYHRGDVVAQVVESTLRLADSAEEVRENIADMKATQLTDEERRLLAEYTIRARFGLDGFDPDSEEFKEARALVPYRPQDFLRPRYSNEVTDDLWATYNTVQRSAIQGHVSRRDADGIHRVRAVNNIGGTIKVNTLVDQFAQELLKFKQGQAASPVVESHAFAL